MGFEEKAAQLFREVGEARKMVLSTAADGRVSSRMMSVVCIDGRFYFQTDTALRKYAQLKRNDRAALCADNLQIEGVCTEIGHPMKDERFCEVFMKHYKGSYDAYTGMESERLFCLEPVYIERWVYISGVPHIEVYDFTEQRFDMMRYPDDLPCDGYKA